MQCVQITPMYTPKQTFPTIVHANGRGRNYPTWKVMASRFYELTYSIPDSVDLILYNNNQTRGILQFQLEQNKTSYTNIATKDYFHFMKIPPRVVAFARQSTKPYILYVDCYDALLCGDLQTGIDLMAQLDVDILFSAEHEKGGQRGRLKKHQMEWILKEEAARYFPPLSHLNGGVWIAKREKAISFFTQVVEKYKHNHIRSNQLNARLISLQDPRSTIDTSGTFAVSIKYMSTGDLLLV